jgi:hypothetical protein
MKKINPIPPDKVLKLGGFNKRYKSEKAKATKNRGMESPWLENAKIGLKKVQTDIHADEVIPLQKYKAYHQYLKRYPYIKGHLLAVRCGSSFWLIYYLVSGVKDPVTGKHVRVVGVLDCLTRKEYDRICR